ncbi:uncharacterized protein V6R79_007246 [Siganus canaliculatus]
MAYPGPESFALMQMPTPHRPLGCPYGLEYLTQINQILIHQKPKSLCIWEMNNVYFVKNSAGQQLFVATEEGGCFTGQLMGRNRPFTIHLHDNRAQEVLTVLRHIECCSPQSIQVQSPFGNPIGYVEHGWHYFTPEFTILDGMRVPVLKIKRPGCDFMCMSDVIFEVMSLDGSAVVGQINRQWRGFLEECSSTADHFDISFPMDLDVKIKAVIIGACFLIDFLYFEQ